MAVHVHTARVSGPSSLSLAYRGGRHPAASAAVPSVKCTCACRDVAISAQRAPGSPWRGQKQQLQQQLLLRPLWQKAEAAAEVWPAVSARHQLQREQKQRQRRFAVRADAGAATGAPEAAGNSVVEKGSVSVVLLAGGVGKRMGAPLPKQYIEINGRPIALYSLLTFAGMEEVGEIVVVCDPSYQYLFEGALDAAGVTKAMRFALPGKERQDSVYNGLQEIAARAALVAVHDSARPLVTAHDVRKVLGDAAEHGAAVLGVPCKATIKEADSSGFVARTLERKLLWEIQTPQVMEPQLLRDGFELVQRDNLEVTDDVSIVEHLKRPVRITEGSYTNIKVTTPDDLLFAERVICGDDASAASPAGSAAMSVAA